MICFLAYLFSSASIRPKSEVCCSEENPRCWSLGRVNLQSLDCTATSGIFEGGKVQERSKESKQAGSQCSGINSRACPTLLLKASVISFTSPCLYNKVGDVSSFGKRPEICGWLSIRVFVIWWLSKYFPRAAVRNTPCPHEGVWRSRSAGIKIDGQGTSQRSSRRRTSQL